MLLHVSLFYLQVPIVVPIIVVIYSTYLVLVPLIYLPSPEYTYVLIFMAIGLSLYFMFVYGKLRIPCIGKFTIYTCGNRFGGVISSEYASSQ